MTLTVITTLIETISMTDNLFHDLIYNPCPDHIRDPDLFHEPDVDHDSGLYLVHDSPLTFFFDPNHIHYPNHIHDPDHVHVHVHDPALFHGQDIAIDPVSSLSPTLSMVMLRWEVVRLPDREDTGLLPIKLLFSPISIFITSFLSWIVWTTKIHQLPNFLFLKIFFASGVGFPLYHEIFYITILQCIRIIVGDAGFELRTSALEV